MIMNLLEIEDAVKGMSDQQLFAEAMRPSGNIPQFLIVSEKQNRDKIRKEFAQKDLQEGTVSERIMAENSGVMSAMPQQMAQGMPPQGMPRMPQQMAMTPQMPQGMPQMPPQAPPQGIQQVMPPQMMSGGGVVRMDNGGVLEEVLATGTDLTQQRLRGLLVAGVPEAQLMQLGYNEDDIARGRSGLQETYNMSISDDYVGGMREIESPARRDPSLVAPSGQRYSPPLAEIASATTDSALGAMADGYNVYDQAVSQDLARSVGPIRRYDIDATQRVKDVYRDEGLGSAIGQAVREAPGYLGALGTSIAGDFNRLTDAAADLPVVYEPARAIQRAVTGSVPEDPTASFLDIELGDIFDGGEDAPKENPNQMVDRLIQEQIDLKEFNEGTFDEGIASVGGPYRDEFLGEDFTGEFEPNDAANPAQDETGKKKPDATRVDIGDATIPRGADAAAGRLSELQAMIDRQSAASSKASQGAALIALGTSIMEGKTAQGGAKAGEILAKDAQTRGALQLEGAKLRLADARQGEKLDIMRQDLINKLKITDRQSLMAALSSYETTITALSNNTTRMMTKEGQAAMRRLNQQQDLLRSLLIPDVDLGGAGAPVGGSEIKVDFADVATS